MADNKSGIYIAIDLKSFYASAECVARGLDPLKANLVIADESRTEKTICLAVTPALKARGIPGRPRLFEVIEKTSDKDIELFIAEPRMKLYMDTSERIYEIYSQFVSEDDIHSYSVDEVFIEVNRYPDITWDNARDFAMKMIKAVYEETGITATCGIGTNLYLSKVAMDIVAKKAEPDRYGVRIAMLDEMTYRRELWNHVPLTDFWCFGHATAATLASRGIYTMGELARASLESEDELFEIFGRDAEIYIDHAWGYECATLEDINSYTTKDASLSSGQVLPHAYDKEKAALILREMTDVLVLDLVECEVTTTQMVIDISCEKIGVIHKSVNLGAKTSLYTVIVEAVEKLFAESVPQDARIRRIGITANELEYMPFEDTYDDQNSMHGGPKEKEQSMQHTIIEMKSKYGKNAVLKGMNFEEGATMRERNEQIGGHKE